ncbi:protein kinase [Nocardia sp. NPDC058640]|uniref:protein kinase domain-containing protein n=1 Tax=Nocardia sp. NPDC058640 TaxID=3346571 RepID=UPI00365E9BD1
MLAPGSVFAGYTILRQLGRGGMGTVYLARHPRLPRNVALKLLARELVADAETLARFEREADLIALLEHPGIVTVFDRGSVNDQPWISMRYVEGTDASRILSHEFDPRRAVRIIVDIASALDYAHEMNVLHRDIKPANILLTTFDGTVERAVLSDFGIARLHGTATHLTATGTVNATLSYASPEQLAGIPLDRAADQYSLACTLFRLLTGRAPFEADDPVATITGHLHLDPPAVSDYRADLPRALDDVVRRALSKQPRHRFPTCVEFAAAAASSLQVPVSDSVPNPMPVDRESAEAGKSSAAVVVTDPEPAQPVARKSRGPRRAVHPRRWQVALFVASVIAVGVGTGLALVSVVVDDSSAVEAPTTNVPRPSWVVTRTVNAAALAEATRTAELLRSTFPRMLPPTATSKKGYLDTECSWLGKSEYPTALDLYDVGFGDWLGEYTCLGGGDGQRAFVIVAYRSPAEVQAVVNGLPVNTRTAESHQGVPVTNYRLSVLESSGFQHQKLITTFPGDATRANMIVYTMPRSGTRPGTPNLDIDAMNTWWRNAPLT